MSANFDKKKNQKKDLPTGATAKDIGFEAEVLFQKIYNKWYAFSVVDEDCLMAEVNLDEIERRTRKISKAS